MQYSDLPEDNTVWPDRHPTDFERHNPKFKKQGVKPKKRKKHGPDSASGNPLPVQPRK